MNSRDLNIILLQIGVCGLRLYLLYRQRQCIVIQADKALRAISTSERSPTQPMVRVNRATWSKYCWMKEYSSEVKGPTSQPVMVRAQ